ncbi:MAG: tyrosine-type recombinase/integrase [Solirubrobacteraceae bacterium]
MSSEGLRKLVAAVMRAAGVGEEHRHPHVLRHTLATLYMQRHGARLEQLQVLMGHASINTTAQYLHTTIAELEAWRPRPRGSYGRRL